MSGGRERSVPSVWLVGPCRGQMPGAGSSPVVLAHPWHGWNGRGAFAQGGCDPFSHPLVGDVTIRSTDPSAHGWIWGLIPSVRLLILAMQEAAFVRVVSAWEWCWQGVPLLAKRHQQFPCQENPLREEITLGRVNGGVAGAVKAVAHPIPSHAISSHPIPCSPRHVGQLLVSKPSSKHAPSNSRARQSSWGEGLRQFCVL